MFAVDNAVKIECNLSSSVPGGTAETTPKIGRAQIQPQVVWA